MTEPTHFSCPDCSFTFQPGDRRFAVPKGQVNRVMACPGCGGAIRVWAPGADPSEKSSAGSYILAGIVIIVVITYVIS